jgi:hypothetical protein
MAHAQKLYCFFRRNGRVHLNRQGSRFNRLLAAEVCASAVVMLDTPCSEVVCRLLATHSIRQFPLHFPSRASPCAIRFEMDSNTNTSCSLDCCLEVSTCPENFYGKPSRHRFAWFFKQILRFCSSFSPFWLLLMQYSEFEFLLIKHLTVNTIKSCIEV